MLQLFSSFAEFEKSRIRERTMEGLAKAKAEGKKLGRPEATETTLLVLEQRAKGLSQAKVVSCLVLVCLLLKDTGISHSNNKMYNIKKSMKWKSNK